MKKRKMAKYKTHILILCLVLLIVVALIFLFPVFFKEVYVSEGTISKNQNTKSEIAKSDQVKEDEFAFVPTYVETPEAVKAIYMTSCVVGTPSFRQDLVDLIEETELNSVIIDIKDYTGGISFDTNNPILKPYISDRCGTYDMAEFIEELHQKGIYVIGRITVFQDPLYASTHPEIAVQKASDRTTWEDYKGINFIDAGARDFWDYIIELSEESHKVFGFDELNFDYIRFPSDGPMKDIYYPISEQKVVSDPELGKAEVVRSFFEYLHENLKDTGVVTSADLFGMVTTNTDDLNIGQILEYALPYFDYIAPMVYPSHYPKGFNGWSNPNHYPHEIIEFSMTSAVERVKEFKNATTTPAWIQEKLDIQQLRPWLQDFDYGGDYGPKEVRTQIEATYDSGLTSWMLWAPSNRYTKEALKSN